MTYQTPSSRKDAVRESVDVLQGARSVVITTHLNADGDGAGCQAALVSWIRALGAEAWIINPTAFPDMFRFLIPNDEWIVPAGSSRAEQLCEEAALAVVVDTGERNRIGRVSPLFEKLVRLVIDHHPPGNDAISGLSFRDSEAAAAGELVYDIILASQGPWTDEVLAGLYVALLTDTGGFRFSNATAGCHRIVADLIEKGVDASGLYHRIYGSAPLKRLRLLEASLRELELDEEMGLAWMTVPDAVCRELVAVADDMEGLVDYPRMIVGVEVGLLFRRTTKGDIKVSFRSNGLVNVNALARQFGGGGHDLASGALIEGDLEQVREAVVASARAAIMEARAATG